MKRVEFKREETWIPGDSPHEGGFYWVTWSINGSKRDTTEMFYDGSKWLYADKELHSTAVIHAYADICYPEPYEE